MQYFKHCRQTTGRVKPDEVKGNRPLVTVKTRAQAYSPLTATAKLEQTYFYIFDLSQN